MSHTPGPWVVEWDGGDAYISQLGGRDTIASTMNLPWNEDCDAPWSEEEHEANALLIAAAPELLEALKMANEMLKDCAEELCAAGMSPIVECIRESTKLIAKAEGK